MKKYKWWRIGATVDFRAIRLLCPLHLISTASDNAAGSSSKQQMSPLLTCVSVRYCDFAHCRYVKHLVVLPSNAALPGSGRSDSLMVYTDGAGETPPCGLAVELVDESLVRT